MNTLKICRKLCASVSFFKSYGNVSAMRREFKTFKMQQSSKTCHYSTAPATTMTNSIDIRQEFREALPTLLTEISDLGLQFQEVQQVGKWIEKVLKYNLAGGKFNRGVSTLIAYKMLERPENITSESTLLASKMGWCVEMFQAYFLVLDDIMDGSQTRRGVPCWYQQPEVGLGAINDAILIQCSMLRTIKKNFGHEVYYPKLLDLFHEVLFQTSIGQHMDLSTAQGAKNDLSTYTIQRFRAIVKYKTAYYSYLLPVRLGLYMSNIINDNMHKLVEDICLEIGVFFQMQDDYLDCFGDSSVTGKIGTDIQEGKCSWPAVTALQRCNQQQLELMDKYFGSKDPDHVEKILQLYKDLKIKEAYLAYEELTYKSLKQKIDSLPEEINHELFLRLLDQIYKRNA